MSGYVDTAAAARLMEALMTDAQLRERFRRDPVATCRAAGLHTLADEMAAGRGKAMQTLDLRESRSSLAGVLMAAAVEGVAVWQIVEHAGDASDLVSDVLSQVSLPAIPDPRGGSGGAPAVATTGAPGDADAAASGMAAVSGDPGGPGDAAAAAGEASASPGDAAADSSEASASPRDAAADSSEASASPGDEAASSSGAAAGASAGPGPATEPPPTTPSAPGSPDGAAPTADGSGAGPAATKAVADLLADDRLGADASLQHALLEGALGERAAATLQAAIDREPVDARLSADGRAIEITSVGGGAVDDANVAARDLAEALGELPDDARPRTIGTPWSIGGPGFTTGPGLDDRLRLELLEPAPARAPDAPGGPGAPAEPRTPAPAPSATRAAAPSPSDGVPAAVQPAAEVTSPAAAQPAAAPPAAEAAVESPTTPSARAASRNDTLTLAVPKADRHAEAPDRNASLTLRAIEDPKAERATAAPSTPDPGARALSPTDYPGDGATKAQFAAWMGAQAQQRGLPAELPVMAALVESGLKNLNYGDRDSVGFFQMRTGIWNQGEYTGYAEKPELQVKWFLDQAEAVKKDRVASGRPIDDPRQFGEWIADVERPAAQYRGRYQLQLDQARALLRQAAAADPPAAPAAEAAPAPVSHVGHDHDEPSADGAVTAPSSPEALAKAAGKAALANDNLHFDEVGTADLKAGKIDPRILAVLSDLSKEHEISVSCMRSDHDKFTAGGSISNHFHGRGVDIATVDGERVEPGSPASRTLAQKIAEMDAAYRPDEVGTPWALSAPGHFTDAGHQDHIHIAFKTDLPGGWRPPRELLGEPVAAKAAAAAPTAAVPSGPVAATEAARSDTLSLPAVAERQSSDAANATHASLRLPAVTEEQAGRAATTPGSDEASAEAEAEAAPAGDGAPAAASADAAPAPAGQVAAAPAGPGAASAADAVAAGKTASMAAGPRALGAVAEAEKYLGTPYLWGGSSPKTGFDCSGLVQWAYARQGIEIPRVTYDQIDAPNGKKIGRDDLRPGDLVFFSTAAGDVHHVGMSLGGDRFIHAPRTGDVVKYSSLNEPYYAGQFVGGRRFDNAAPVAPAPPAAAAGAEPVARRAGLEAAAPDPAAVEAAEAARVRDAEAVRDPNSMVFRALSQQEAVGHRSTMEFLAAVKPQEAKRLGDAAAQAGIDTAPAIPQGAVGYPGDDAGREALARWLASQARKHGLPPELPVMAALVESNVQNLNYGDRDSVGFFQMRTGSWNQGEYAGYDRKPELQAKWFVDHALAVKRARIAAGIEDFGRDPSSWGEWIADVERPAEQYRGRYQLRLAEARRLLGR